jgi:hypothetical protein
MGGPARGEAGILPRTLDVIFNSIAGLESDSDVSAMSARPSALVLTRLRSCDLWACTALSACPPSRLRWDLGRPVV